jgi:DeoR/GlpR family transcriptional regulator of sugar metabolism
MLARDRHQRILSLLGTLESVTTERIAADLGVSRETVRRDVLELEARGDLRRVHGGIVAVDIQPEAPLAVRSGVRQKEKRQIAKAAARLVKPGQTLFIDAGSTVTTLAEELASLSGLTIITNSFDVATRLAGHDSTRNVNEIIVLGGRPGSGIAATYGAITVAEIGRYRADIALLSPVGLSARYGATSFDLAEAEVARAMVEHSQQVVILADHSKIGQTSRVGYCAIERIDILVVDAASSVAIETAGLGDVMNDIILA